MFVRVSRSEVRLQASLRRTLTFRPCVSFHKFTYSPHQLVDDGIVALLDVVDDAALDMCAQQLLIEGVYRRASGGGLLEYIVAVGVVLQHRDDPAYLPLDAPEPVDESLLLSVIAMCGAYAA